MKISHRNFRTMLVDSVLIFDRVVALIACAWFSIFIWRSPHGYYSEIIWYFAKVVSILFVNSSVLLINHILVERPTTYFASWLADVVYRDRCSVSEYRILHFILINLIMVLVAACIALTFVVFKITNWFVAFLVFYMTVVYSIMTYATFRDALINKRELNLSNYGH